jgi:hypothetical protein
MGTPVSPAQIVPPPVTLYMFITQPLRSAGVIEMLVYQLQIVTFAETGLPAPQPLSEALFGPLALPHQLAAALSVPVPLLETPKGLFPKILFPLTLHKAALMAAEKILIPVTLFEMVLPVIVPLLAAPPLARYMPEPEFPLTVFPVMVLAVDTPDVSDLTEMPLSVFPVMELPDSMLLLVALNSIPLPAFPEILLPDKVFPSDLDR